MTASYADSPDLQHRSACVYRPNRQAPHPHCARLPLPFLHAQTSRLLCLQKLSSSHVPGELAVKQRPEEFAPFAAPVAERLVPILAAAGAGAMPRSLVENAAITLGRVAWVCPAQVRRHSQRGKVDRVICRASSHIRPGLVIPSIPPWPQYASFLDSHGPPILLLWFDTAPPNAF